MTEEMVHACEPEAGRNLSDEEERSVSDLINCQEGRDEFSNCQVGNEMRSLEDLIDCQEDNHGNSYCQEGNGMRLTEDLINCQVGRSGLSSCQVGNGKRSVEGLAYCQGSSGESSDCQVGNEMGSLDLIDCQVGSRKFPNCQVGRGKEMRLSESLMNSEESSDQQGVLTGEDQKSILMIGGIRVFLPHSPVEARECVADAATEERQPTETVMEEEMEQTLMFSQGEEEEHSTEWLKIFSQEAEQEITAVLEAAEEEEEEEEEADNMDFVGLCEELEALERRVMVQNLHIQQAKLEEGSGAYQPQEKLEEVGTEPTQRNEKQVVREGEKQLSKKRLQNWSLQQSGHLSATKEIKMAWEI
jgi:hypothetical protein